MEKIIIRKERIPSRDPRLKRHVYHDSRSKLFRFDTSKLTIVSVTHNRNIPILDQGSVGSCTGNAGIGGLATNPNYPMLPKVLKYPLNQEGAVKLYSDAQVIDGNGPYPPNDYGSCGLSIAKALKNAGIITGYQHTFSLEDALKALTVTPILVGMNWYDSMFRTQKDGRVAISGGIAGGHEVMARQIDATNKRVWFDNSWGKSWGLNGRFYLTFADFDRLLKEDGDVIALTMGTAPAPKVNTDDDNLAAAMKLWLKAKGY